MAKRDLWLSSDGDIEVGYDGDIKLSEDIDTDTQTIALRVKTETGELALHPEIGASLSILIGKRLTPENLSLGESLVLDSLILDGELDEDRLLVRGVPLTKNSVLFIVEMLDSNLKREIALTIPFDFNYGTTLSDIKAVGSDSVYGA